MPHKYLLKEFEEFSRSASNAESVMKRVSERIHMHIPRYNWVGFYLVDKKDSFKLVLGPHTGSFTPAQTISLDQGICGSAASTNRTVVIDNAAESPYALRASDLVKSQIAAPVMAGSKTIGALCVDSYFVNAFTATIERDFVEACARVVGRCAERTAAPTLVHV
jgi:L-methionine (R)-S-oxide reductase